ncbi:MAG: tRNA 2-thiocytidine(32) synthetase TtcA [Syntrophomonadaceae bacterium]|nr:tRNA 2-thiocytidine(32) synthetase TtcA [Syntrophomonadaceae bacterium]
MPKTKTRFRYALEQKLGQAIGDFNLIQDGDRIAIGLSGGKDSVILLWLLARLQKKAPVDFHLTAITLDMGWGLDYSALDQFCRQLQIPLHIEYTNMGHLIFEERKEKNPCSLCARLRRGALNNLARQLHCNKIALAHHADDAVITLLMSMFYTGRLTTFRPSTYMSRQDLWVIRPLVYIREAVIEEAVTTLNLPIVKNTCPASGITKRQEVKEILADLEDKIPGVFSRLLGSLQNVEINQFWI